MYNVLCWVCWGKGLDRFDSFGAWLSLLRWPGGGPKLSKLSKPGGFKIVWIAWGESRKAQNRAQPSKTEADVRTPFPTSHQSRTSRVQDFTVSICPTAVIPCTGPGLSSVSRAEAQQTAQCTPRHNDGHRHVNTAHSRILTTNPKQWQKSETLNHASFQPGPAGSSEQFFEGLPACLS